MSMHSCHQIFDLMDRDKGGTLGADEIKQLMDMLGMRVSGVYALMAGYCFGQSCCKEAVHVP